MKISTRLKLAALAPLVLAAVISLAFLFSYTAVEKAQTGDQIAQHLILSASELADAARTYLFYRRNDSKQLFLQTHEEIRTSLLAVRLDDSEQQRLLNGIRRNMAALRASFEQVVAVHERHAAAGARGREEKRLSDQITNLLRGVLADAARLEGMIDADIAVTQKRISIAIVFFIITLTVPLTTVVFRMMKSIALSLKTLRSGTELIGSGHLDHRIGLSAHDELGDLSRAFDRMTERLQAVTVSKDELQKEMEERKKAEEEVFQLNSELKHYVRQLEESNRELEAFSYSVSHDLRSPLRSIAGFSQALLEDYAGRLDAQGRDFLDRIIAGANRMGRLIDDLLNLSRVSRHEMTRGRVDLSAVARTISGKLGKSDPERAAEFLVEDGLMADGDEQLLNVMLENLFANAWKYSEKSPRTVIEFGVAKHDGEKVYFVRDRGAGFDMRYVDKLFNAFQRLHRATEFPGTGIGLATVKRVVSRHGGRVWIEGEEGKGATVYFTL